MKDEALAALSVGTLIKAWPLVIGLIGLLAYGIRLDVQVQDLIAKREGDRRQWQIIGELKERVSVLETEMRLINR